MENNVDHPGDELDRELAIIRDVWKLIEPLKPEVRQRVLHWLTARSFDRHRFPRMPPGEMLGGNDVFGPL